jgi:CheY-like chemotaxis protein
MRQLLTHQKELQQEVDIRTQTILRDKELIEQQTRQLQQQAEEKMRFFANVTHEFRTPLSLISGPINKFINMHPFGSQDAELLHIAYQNSQQLSDFVTQLSYLSSAENDQLRVHSEPVLIYSFLHHKMKEYELLASSKNLIFNHHIDIDPSVYLLADKKNIQLIINNLISNSLKFTPKHKNIFFTAAFSAGHLSITVRDEGRGIPKEDLPYVFDRYFQSRQQHAPIEGGTGIGLALVKEIVNALNGSITVESKPGQGSTFRLSLPLTLAQAETAQTYEHYDSTEDTSVLEPITLTVKPPEGKDKFKLLLAEDNPYLQRYISILLEDHFEIHICSNGQEALDYLQQQETPDLLITDLMMPALDGLQLLQEIKNNPTWKYMPVLMLTARSLRQDQAKAITLGVDDYIIKPFLEAELFASLNNLLAKKQIRAASGQPYMLRTHELLTEDKHWLVQLETVTLANIDKEEFNVNQLAKLMFMSRTLFYQRTRELTGMTPSQYILEMRLQQARRLLEASEETSFKKITQAVGLKDDRHFFKIYKQRFGKSPLDYA